MAQFREGQFGLDCLMVLASVDDHEKQEQAWAAASRQWTHRPDCLRQLLTHGEIESDRDPVAKYVTLQAYEKAGGALRRDLFSDDDKKVYLLDAALLERLAADKLQKRAKQVQAEGWKWVDIRVRYDYDEYVKYGELRKARREPDALEAVALEELDGRISSLYEQMDVLAGGGDEDAYYKLSDEADGLQAQRKKLAEALCIWPADLLAQAGCVVHVGPNGAAAVKYGLIRPEDRRDMVQAARETGEDDAGGPLVSLPLLKTRPAHSEKLLRRLTAHCVAAVQAELIDRPDVALAAFTAQLAQRMLKDHDYRYFQAEPAFAISATDQQFELRSAAEDMEIGAAWVKIQAARAGWTDRLSGDPEAVFPWLLAQDQATVLQLLACAVAATVTDIYGTEPDRQSNDALAQALGLDMSKWWSATGASYFNHVSKARILDVVAEAVDANAASPLAALKKDATVAGAEQTLAGKGWLPSCLRVRTVDVQRGEIVANDMDMEPEAALAA